MAKKATNKKQKSLEETLWDSANKLRGSVEPSEYKHIVLSLIFLKFASEKFEHRRQELIDEEQGDYVDMVEFYTMKNVFYLPEEARWSYIKQHAKQNDIAIKIDTALHTAEKTNKALKGALPDNYFSRLNLDVSKLAALLDTINNIQTMKDKEQDIIGRIYEYFLSKFALAEGKGKGEFYTPKSIVNLIAEMIEPYKGKIYDPCCGSGGMFVQSMKFVENHQGNKKARTVEHGNISRQYRDREDEILFMDLRKIGEPFEKKFIQFSEKHIQEISNTYHTWQQTMADTEYENIPEYCYSANIDEVRAKDYSLVPSKYIAFVNRDENIDFDEKMKSLQAEFAELLKAEEESKKELLNVFKELGYEIKL